MGNINIKRLKDVIAISGVPTTEPQLPAPLASLYGRVATLFLGIFGETPEVMDTIPQAALNEPLEGITNDCKVPENQILGPLQDLHIADHVATFLAAVDVLYHQRGERPLGWASRKVIEWMGAGCGSARIGATQAQYLKIGVEQLDLDWDSTARPGC